MEKTQISGFEYNRQRQGLGHAAAAIPAVLKGAVTQEAVALGK
jgi:hypothetical protein